MAKFYVYRGFNEHDGLAGYAESREQAQAKIQESINYFTNTCECKLDDIYEFDCEEAYFASKLYNDICRGTGLVF